MMIEKCNIVYSHSHSHSQCTEMLTVTVCRMLVLTLQSVSPVIILFCTGYDSQVRPPLPPAPALLCITTATVQNLSLENLVSAAAV